MKKKYLLILACGLVISGCTTKKYITNNPPVEPDTLVVVDTVKAPHDLGHHFGQDKDKGKP